MFFQQTVVLRCYIFLNSRPEYFSFIHSFIHSFIWRLFNDLFLYICFELIKVFVQNTLHSRGCTVVVKIESMTTWYQTEWVLIKLNVRLLKFCCISCPNLFRWVTSSWTYFCLFWGPPRVWLQRFRLRGR